MDQEKFNALLDKTKRACRMCYTYKRTDFDRGEKQKALADLQGLIQFFGKQFSELRRKEEASGETVQNALQNKRLCMDLLDECSSCGKEFERIAKGLLKLKK